MGRLRPEPLVLIKSNLTKSKGHNSAGVQLIEPSKAEVIRARTKERKHRGAEGDLVIRPEARHYGHWSAVAAWTRY